MASARRSTTRAVVVFYPVAALLVIMVDYVASATGDAHLASDPAPGAIRRPYHCNGSIAQCVDGVEWPSAAGLVGEIPRRSLASGGYIGYPPILQSGRPGAAPAGPINRYTRGCNAYNRCRGGSFVPHN